MYIAGGLSGGAIAGIVVGVLVAVIVAMVVGIILIYLLWSHKNKSKYVPGSRVSLKNKTSEMFMECALIRYITLCIFVYSAVHMMA